MSDFQKIGPIAAADIASPEEARPTAADTWTVVGRGKKKRKPRLPSMKILNAPSRDVTLADIVADFERKMETWRQSECRKQILRTLDRIQPDGGWQVSKAVCLASGSFSRDNLECRRRTMWQFVVYVDLTQQLGISERLGADVLAQEPFYTPLDEKFLKSLGVTILDVNLEDAGSPPFGPAQRYLTPECFLFEPFLDMGPDKLRALLKTDLPIYIGSSLQWAFRSATISIEECRRRLVPSGMPSDPDSAVDDQITRDLVHAFRQRHGMYHFPCFEPHSAAFEGISIYWLADQQSDGQ